MDALRAAWADATWTERLVLVFWSIVIGALFTVGTVVSAGVTLMGGMVTGLITACMGFVALAPRISGSEARRRDDGLR